MRFHSVALGLCLCANAVSAAEVTGYLAWDHPVAQGVSGIEVLGDGASFVAVSDQGWFLSGTLEWTDDALSGVDLQDVQPVRGHKGFPTSARRVGDWSDAEGIAISPDGSIFVGFERWMHVGQFETTTAPQTIVTGPPEFFEYSENRQIEALALHPGGKLFAWPERPLKGDQFDVYRHDGSDWQSIGKLQEVDGFSVVGADFSDNGDLFILERKLVLGVWWQNRIRKVQDLDWAAAEILWTGGRGDFENLEGIAVIEGAPRRLILVGDNNRRNETPTDIVEITLTD